MCDSSSFALAATTLKVTSFLNNPRPDETRHEKDTTVQRLIPTTVITPARMSGYDDPEISSKNASVASLQQVAMSILMCLSLYHPKDCLDSDDSKKLENGARFDASHS